MLGSSFLGSAAGSVIRDATSWNRDEMIARMLIPKPAMYQAGGARLGEAPGNWPEGDRVEARR